MQNIFKKIFAILFIISTLVACNDNSGLIEGYTKPVVEAYLVPNQPIFLHIKKEIPYTDESSGIEETIDALNVKVTGDGQTYLLKSIGNGDYQSDPKVKLKVGSAYSLNFDYGGRTISAITTIPARPQGFKSDRPSIALTKVDFGQGGFGGQRPQDDNTPINLTWLNPTNEYHFVVVDNIETNPIEIITRPVDPNRPQNNNRRFRNQPVQGVTTQLRPQQFQYFGVHNVILLKVNPDYAALYQRSGTNSQNISTPPSSITNGLGIFTGVNSDTLKFYVLQN